MSKESESNDKAIYPQNKDWANYTVNLHDGWADDVSLAYPDDRWTPDTEQLTLINLEDSISESDDEFSELYEDFSDEHAKRKKSIISTFSLFMIAWIFLLVALSSVLLYSYYDFLVRFQKSFDESKPDIVMEKYISWFDDADMDSVYNALTSKPDVTLFEDDFCIKKAIMSEITGKEITFSHSSNYSNQIPEYNIYADKSLIAVMELRRTPEYDSESEFSDLYISRFSLEPLTSYTIHIINDSNLAVDIFINDVALSDAYLDNSGKSYTIDGLYNLPDISAISSSGKEASIIFDENSMTYTIK